jgi:hypothetical protein
MYGPACLVSAMAGFAGQIHYQRLVAEASIGGLPRFFRLGSNLLMTCHCPSVTSLG